MSVKRQYAQYVADLKQHQGKLNTNRLYSEKLQQ